MNNVHFYFAPTDLFIVICSYLNVLECIEEMCKIWRNIYFSFPWAVMHWNIQDTSSYFIIWLHTYPYLLISNLCINVAGILLCETKQNIYKWFVFSTQQLWNYCVADDSIMLLLIATHCYLNSDNLSSCNLKTLLISEKIFLFSTWSKTSPKCNVLSSHTDCLLRVFLN